MDFQAGSAVVDMVAIDTERAVREDLGNLASRWHSMEQTVGGGGMFATRTFYLIRCLSGLHCLRLYSDFES
jgi:hypothetical protein